MARQGQLKKNTKAPPARGRGAGTADGQSTGHPHWPALAATVPRMAGAGEVTGPGRTGAGLQGTWALEEERQARLLGWATRAVDATASQMGSSLQGAPHDIRKPRECRRSLQPRRRPCGPVPGDGGGQDSLRHGGPLLLGHLGQQHRRQRLEEQQKGHGEGEGGGWAIGKRGSWDVGSWGAAS